MNTTAATRIRLASAGTCCPNSKAGFGALTTLEQIDANHRSPALRKARPTATADVAARSAVLLDPEPGRVERHLSERIELLDRRVEALGEHVGEAVDARAATGHDDAVDVIGAGGAAEEVEGLLHFEQDVLADGAENRPRLLEVDAVDDSHRA